MVRSIADDGSNPHTKEYWTTIGGRRVYSHDMEALCRTVGFGWTLHKERMICIYCGIESYRLDQPCVCFGKKGDTGKRTEAIKRLLTIVRGNEAKEKRAKKAIEKTTDSGIVIT